MPKTGTTAQRATEIASRLAVLYPGAECELAHETPFQLLAATILSAQCTDARVNMVTPALFARYPTPGLLAVADPADVEGIIRSTGFFATKARNLIGMARAVTERFGGEVPRDLDDLVTLPGVGRKTGNVLRSVAYDLPGLAVDTHVGRLSRRLGLTVEEDPVKVERDLNELIEPPEWGRFSLRLILHGRRVCDAKKPRCTECELADVCPSATLGSAAAPTKKAVAKKAVAKKAATKKRAMKKASAKKTATKTVTKRAAARKGGTR